jgi:anaerobic selenocysteine-containing dehydrogenase
MSRMRDCVFVASRSAPVNASDNPATEILGACPHECPDTCSMVTTVQNGVAIKVHDNAAHAHTHGALCTKVSRYPERTYHP